MRKIRARIRFLAAALLGLLVASMAQADDDSPGKLAGDRKEVPRFLIELKREATNRGTLGETSIWILVSTGPGRSRILGEVSS
ncbi:MAG: hypothetical protein ABSB32_08345 [Thermodesulfobacteriota bacterium]